MVTNMFPTVTVVMLSVLVVERSSNGRASSSKYCECLFMVSKEVCNLNSFKTVAYC